MADGDDGLLVSAMTLHAVIPGLQRRAVLARRGQARLDQRRRRYRLPLRVFPLRRLPALSFCPGHIAPQLHKWPADGNRRHVAARFSHHADRPDPIHPRNRVQRRQHRLERGRRSSIRRSAAPASHRGSQSSPRSARSETRDGAGTSLQRRRNAGSFLRSLPRASSASTSGSVVPSTRAAAWRGRSRP